MHNELGHPTPLPIMYFLSPRYSDLSLAYIRLSVVGPLPARRRPLLHFDAAVGIMIKSPPSFLSGPQPTETNQAHRMRSRTRTEVSFILLYNCNAKPGQIPLVISYS